MFDRNWKNDHQFMVKRAKYGIVKGPSFVCMRPRLGLVCLGGIEFLGIQRPCLFVGGNLFCSFIVVGFFMDVLVPF